MDLVEKNVYEAYENIAELYDKELWNDMPYNNQIDEIMQLFEKCNLEIIKMEKIRDDAEFELGNEQLAFYLRKK